MLYCLMALTRFAFLILLSCGVLGAEEIPQLKARAGMPVIQELMGDCSLTCAFPWEAVTGTSTFGGGIAVLNDADSLTAWTNAQIGDTRRWQHVSFPDVDLNVGDTLAIEVLDTYPRKKGHHRNRASRRALKIPSTANAERNGRNRPPNVRVNYRICDGESDTSFSKCDEESLLDGLARGSNRCRAALLSGQVCGKRFEWNGSLSRI